MEPPLGHCKVCGSKKVLSRNLCDNHYRKMRISGELPDAPAAPKVCHCGAPAAAKGRCWKHYQRERRKAQSKPPCHDGKNHQWTITGRCMVCQMEK